MDILEGVSHLQQQIEELLVDPGWGAAWLRIRMRGDRAKHMHYRFRSLIAMRHDQSRLSIQRPPT